MCLTNWIKGSCEGLCLGPCHFLFADLLLRNVCTVVHVNVMLTKGHCIDEDFFMLLTDSAGGSHLQLKAE